MSQKSHVNVQSDQKETKHQSKKRNSSIKHVIGAFNCLFNISNFTLKQFMDKYNELGVESVILKCSDGEYLQLEIVDFSYECLEEVSDDDDDDDDDF